MIWSPVCHARALRRGLRQRRHDRDPAVAHVDLDAEPGVVARRLLGERLVVVAGEQHRVGVLELLQHAAGGLIVQLGLADRVDVVGVHVAEHVVEQPRLLIDVAAARDTTLQQPAAAQERDHGHQHDHTPALLHTASAPAE